jgi:hypothetical protein
MHKVGNYKYPSKNFYEFIVFTVMIVFVILVVILNVLRENMNLWVYHTCVVICYIMMFHLALRFMHSQGWIKYKYYTL